MYPTTRGEITMPYSKQQPVRIYTDNETIRPAILMQIQLLRVSLLTVLVLLCLVNSKTFAATATQSAHKLIETTTSTLLTRLQNNKSAIVGNTNAAEALIQDIIAPHFDFERMSRLVLGKYWRQASMSQRASFPVQFQTLLTRTYATALAAYSDQEINYLPDRNDDPNDVLVRTEIVQNGGPSIPVHYRLYRNNETWKIYDVIIDGISLVTTYRSSFASEIRRAGLDSLIDNLARKNQQVAEANRSN
jgi:phospholipid transport system substrate-binding protein